MIEPLYLDNAAATPLDPEVKAVYIQSLDEYFANSTAIHRLGQRSRQALEGARRQIAGYLNCKPTELVFTGSATESNNLAIGGLIGGLRQTSEANPHVIYSGLEHASVQSVLESSDIVTSSTKILENFAGIISLPSILQAIRKETVLISLMLVNNELGTLQAVADLGKKLKKINKERLASGLPKIYLHTDASQAVQFVQLDVEELGADLMTLSAQKIYAPKGVALLYVRHATPLQPQLRGGGQEHGLRSGTNNVPGAVAMAKALEICVQKRDLETERLSGLRDRFIQSIRELHPGLELNGFNRLKPSDWSFWQDAEWLTKTRKLYPDGRIANNINLIWRGMDQQQLLTFLDLHHVCVSSGSSCASGSGRISEIALLTQDIVTEPQKQAIIRITMGRYTRPQELDRLLEVLKEAAVKLG